MNQQDIVNKIKSKNWDNRVQRPGFYQSKQIVVEAKNQRVYITKDISVLDSNNVWIRNSCAYDDDVSKLLFSEIFPKAFAGDPYWPVAIFNELESLTPLKEEFVRFMHETDWSKASNAEKIDAVQKYVDTLCRIQKYYAIAVPLTNYGEMMLKENDESMLQYAVQYRALDVDRLSQSLIQIQKERDQHNRNLLIDEHLKIFGWIKTNYNIIEDYTKADVLNEIKSDMHAFKPLEVPESPYRHYAVGLQIGIYLRNRMKEMSQQIWFAYEQLARQLAKDLNISRPDFLQLHYKEVIDSLKAGRLSVSKDEIQARHKGFVAGVLDNEEFCLTGTIVDELSEYINAVNTDGVHEFKGNIACKGNVRGIVKVVATIAEIGKLQEGDILVTSMTTPDFIVAMKKAAAFVTDEGGLSCHAAIVSRELRKPCIIGTKIATKVLKDGDIIEVDANTGTVKILK